MRKKFIFALIIGLCFFVLTSCWGKVEVKFDSRGGTSVPTITDKDDFDANNLPVPAKEGHTFLGWYLDSTTKRLLSAMFRKNSALPFMPNGK